MSVGILNCMYCAATVLAFKICLVILT